MEIASRRNGFSTILGVFALAVAVSACRPKPPEAPPAPVPPAPEVSAPAAPAADATTEPASPSIAAAPATAAAATQAASARVPDVSAMKLATPSSPKLGVPVDLRYQFDDAVEPGRPVTLHLAAVPRVAGSNLSVSIKEVEGLDARAAPLAMQKASAGTAYRQQLAVTRMAGGPAELRVLVTMETPEGSAFSWFGVPLVP